MFIIHGLLSKPCNIINSNIYSLSLFRPSVHYLRTIVCFTGLSDCFVMPFCTLRPNLFCSAAKEGKSAVLDYLQFKVLALRFDLLTQIALRRTFSQDVLGHLVTRRTCKNPLSWICFSLTEFRLLCSAQAGSICSLPGLASLRSLHPSANPLSWIFTFRAS